MLGEPIELTGEILEGLHTALLELMVEVDRICRKNGIKYSLAGGSLLGAVRHKGFIPWDDDADLSMYRTEYERFREALKTDLDETRFYFHDMRATPGYRWGYGKLRRKGTLFMRDGQEHMPYEQGVFIDIFPFDCVPEGYIRRHVHCFHCFVVRKILWSEVGKTNDKSALARGVYRVLSRIPLPKMSAYLQKFTVRYNNGKNTRVRPITMPMRKGLTDEGALLWYEELTELPFEGINFMATKHYTEWLSLLYGDYMKIPPPEQRHTHPVSKILLPETSRGANGKAD